MGIKTEKNTAAANALADELMDRLRSIGGIDTKKMFGGRGFMHQERMFGFVDSKANFFLKADDALKQELEEQGGERHSRMPYISISDELLRSDERVLDWVKRAMQLTK